jgi:hypothetical protein
VPSAGGGAARVRITERRAGNMPEGIGGGLEPGLAGEVPQGRHPRPEVIARDRLLAGAGKSGGGADIPDARGRAFVRGQVTLGGELSECRVLEAGGVVVRYGQLYGPGTFYPDRVPPHPRIHVIAAAEATPPLIRAPSGIVIVTDDALTRWCLTRWRLTGAGASRGRQRDDPRRAAAFGQQPGTADQVPPAGPDPVNSRPSADAARAASGSGSRVTEATSRCSASRFATSSRLKLYTTCAADPRLCGSRTLCASWGQRSPDPSCSAGRRPQVHGLGNTARYPAASSDPAKRLAGHLGGSDRFAHHAGLRIPPGVAQDAG